MGYGKFGVIRFGGETTMKERDFKTLRFLAMAILIISAVVKGIQTLKTGMRIPPLGVALALIFAIIYLTTGAKINQILLGKDRYVIYLRRQAFRAFSRKLYSMVVGICEELVFRGYIFSFFLEKTGDNYAVTVIVSSILFTMWHLVYGKRYLSKHYLLSEMTFGSLTGLLVTIYPGNIWLPIIMHLTVHVFIFFATDLLIRSINKAAA